MKPVYSHCSQPTAHIGNSTATPTTVPAGGPPDRVLDIRPIFARGESPCDTIDGAVADLAPGQALVLLVPFEPIPLYTRLGRKGLTPQSRQLPDGTWEITFRPAAS